MNQTTTAATFSILCCFQYSHRCKCGCFKSNMRKRLLCVSICFNWVDIFCLYPIFRVIHLSKIFFTQPFIPFLVECENNLKIFRIVVFFFSFIIKTLGNQKLRKWVSKHSTFLWGDEIKKKTTTKDTQYIDNFHLANEMWDVDVDVHVCQCLYFLCEMANCHEFWMSSNMRAIHFIRLLSGSCSQREWIGQEQRRERERKIGRSKEARNISHFSSVVYNSFISVKYCFSCLAHCKSQQIQ